MEEQVKQIERDLVLLGLIADYIGVFKKTLKDYILDYDGNKVSQLGDKYIKSDDQLNDIFKQMAREAYDRLRSRFCEESE